MDVYEALKAEKNTKKLDSTQITNNTGWEYSENENKMGEKVYYAQNISSEDLGFDFPYENSFASIVIRNKAGKNDIIFKVTKGQIQQSLIDGGKLRVRFDNEAPFSINFVGTSDGSSNVIFLENTKKLINKFKTSNKFVIEVEFYENGSRQIEFNTKGFKWNH